MIVHFPGLYIFGWFFVDFILTAIDEEFEKFNLQGYRFSLLMSGSKAESLQVLHFNIKTSIVCLKLVSAGSMKTSKVKFSQE